MPESARPRGIVVLPVADEMIATYRPDLLSADEYRRLVAWMADAGRKPAGLEFTAGILRDVASAFEAAARATDSGRAGQ